MSAKKSQKTGTRYDRKVAHKTADAKRQARKETTSSR